MDYTVETAIYYGEKQNEGRLFTEPTRGVEKENNRM